MKIGIIGAGLVGGSIGLAAKRSVPDARVAIFDVEPSSSERAVARGAADRGATSIEDCVGDAEVVFIAVPVSAIPKAVIDAAGAAGEGTILTDVGSTKHHLILEVESLMPKGRIFVGGHPMAGSEEEGIDGSRADLFDGAWWILTPSEQLDTGAYRKLHGLLTTLGARVMALDPAEHDRVMAVVSHLPQVIATTLMTLAGEARRDHEAVLELAAGGFRDMTRIAASSPAVWADICVANGQAIYGALDAFSRQLRSVGEQISLGDRDGLLDAFEQGRRARRSLPVKPSVGAPSEVRMPVPDRPGVLAEVTTTIGAMGINIEDLEIVHAPEGGKGFLHLLVPGQEDANRAADALRALGYDARTATT